MFRKLYRNFEAVVFSMFSQRKKYSTTHFTFYKIHQSPSESQNYTHVSKCQSIIIIILSTLSVPRLRRSYRHHRWFHNQFPPFFSVLHCLLGLGELQACPFADVIFLPLLLSALSSSSFQCALQDGFGKTWWTGDMSIPLQFASLYLSLIHIWRCRRDVLCRSRWSPYH